MGDGRALPIGRYRRARCFSLCSSRGARAQRLRVVW